MPPHSRPARAISTILPPFHPEPTITTLPVLPTIEFGCTVRTDRITFSSYPLMNAAFMVQFAAAACILGRRACDVFSAEVTSCLGALTDDLVWIQRWRSRSRSVVSRRLRGRRWRGAWIVGLLSFWIIAAGRFSRIVLIPQAADLVRVELVVIKLRWESRVPRIV